jgi:hypothetical protein
MRESFFKAAMALAYKSIKANDRPQYYMGYMRGLRRRYHGERFGTNTEHKQWLTLDGSYVRDEIRKGYTDGYYGPDSAPKTLRMWHDWSVEDLATRCGRSPRTIEGWESGREIPAAAQKTLELLRLSD